MGSIYLAKLLHTSLYYDILVIRKDALLKDEELKKKVKRQKDVLFVADHAFHKGMKNQFVQEARIFFVTPHLQGISLSGFLQENGGVLQEAAIKFIAFQLVLAIGDLHSKDIMYRSLNPDNIFVESDGYIKLISFENS